MARLQICTWAKETWGKSSEFSLQGSMLLSPGMVRWKWGRRPYWIDPYTLCLLLDSLYPRTFKSKLSLYPDKAK
jgi:hypothetical protein